MKTGILLIVISLMLGCEESTTKPDLTMRLDFEPLIQMKSPVGGSKFTPGDTITFLAEVHDVEDKYFELQVVWSSSLDGLLASGKPDSNGTTLLKMSELSHGVHSILLTVTDSDNNIAADSILIVNNLPKPVVLNRLRLNYQSISLTWQPSDDPEFDAYKIYRSETAGKGSAGDLLVTLGNASDTTFQDTSIELGAHYYYQIFTSNKAGESIGSNQLGMPEGIETRLDLNRKIGTMIPGANNQYLFATDRINNQVVVIDIKTATIAYEIATGLEPYGLAINADKNEIYVANSGQTNITVIDLDDMMVKTEINCAQSLALLTYSPITNKLYATLTSSGDPKIIDVDSYEVVSSIQAISYLYHYAMCEASQTDAMLYIGERGLTPASIYKVDIAASPPTLILENPFAEVGSNLQDMKLSHDGNTLFLACGSPYYIQMINTSTFGSSGSLVTGAYPTAIAVTPDGTLAYAAHSSNEIQIYALATMLQVGVYHPGADLDDDALEVSPDGNWLFARLGGYTSNQDIMIIKIRDEN